MSTNTCAKFGLQHGVSEESRVVTAQVIKSMNQQEDEDTYEPKSVREIKAMFNKPSKPVVPGKMKLRQSVPIYHRLKAVY